ncbi:hypothetical protein [Aeromicrobium alkaliterrae]|uniref:LPXTG cell wall anchor domain-containing protein n=1 Tax=Aeromicrobium alkaliterrae TaxID=302168 RepID=A0ABP4VJB2_9ACTN
MSTLGIIVLVAGLAVVAAGAALVLLRRRSRRPAPATLSREELAQQAEQHRSFGGREHGQNPSVARNADHGGWG